MAQQTDGYQTDQNGNVVTAMNGQPARANPFVNQFGMVTPVALDLDGNGISINPLASSNTFFDMAGDGLQHRTSWAGAGDGVLVRDAGNDGVINQKNEVDFTSWDPSAKTDMQALLDVFDTNHNGKLDAGDTDWSLFKVMVTNADGTTTLKTTTQLGITSINLVSNNQEVALPGGSKINGTATFLKSDGSTGTVADTTLAYDANGYVVGQTVTHNADATTIVENRAANTDGSLASDTVAKLSADGSTVTTTFDDDGDGIIDRLRIKTTAVNAGVSTTETRSSFDGSGTVLLGQEVRVTSADTKTVTISRDSTGGGFYDQTETDVIAADGSQTVTVTDLHRDSSVGDKRITTTSADGLTKAVQTQLTGSGAINATRTANTNVAGDGTRTETIADYAGAATAAANRAGSVITVKSADGNTKSTTTDVDGDAWTDLVTGSVRIVNADQSATTTVSDTNRDGSLRDRVLTTLSADGNVKTVQEDRNGNSTYEHVVVDAKVFNADGSTTETVTETNGDGSRRSQSVSTWSADGKTRSTSIDSDGDGNVDQTEAVAPASGNSVDSVSHYSLNGSILLSKSVTTTGSTGLSSTQQVDADGNGSFDATSSSVTVINADQSSTTTVTTLNGAGSSQIGKTVTTVSANGLSTTRQSFVGSTLVETITNVTVVAADKSTTQIVTSLEGSSGVQASKVVTFKSADRLTTTVSSYVGSKTLAQEVDQLVIANDGSMVKTQSVYSVDGMTLVSRVTATTSADGLTVTTAADRDGNGVVDSTQVAAKTLNSDGTTTTTTTIYSGSGVATANKVSQSIVTTAANGFSETLTQDLNGDGTVDLKKVIASNFYGDGSRYDLVVTSNGSGSVQTGKTNTSTSDDKLTGIQWSYLSNHSVVDATTTDTKVLNADGSTTETVLQYAASGALASRSVQTSNAIGSSKSQSEDYNADGVNDRVTTLATGSDDTQTTTVSTYSSAGGLTSKSTTTKSGNGLVLTQSTDLDGNGSTDKSLSDTVILNSDGSKSETLSHFSGTGVLQDKSTNATSADGLSSTTSWDITGAGTTTRSHAETAVINADGSTTKTVSNLNANGSLHDKLITTSSADGTSSTATFDRNGDGVIDQTVSTAIGDDGATTTSQMDGTVQSASGRLYGSLRGRYDLVNSAGLSHLTRFDANGDGLAESQINDAVALNSDGSTTDTVTNSTLSGGSSTSANPTYVVTNKEQSVTTTSVNGQSVTTQYDLTGTGTFTESVSDVNTPNTDGSSTHTTTRMTGATLSRKLVTTRSGDGLTTTIQLDSAGAGSFDQTMVTSHALNTDGTTTDTLTTTNGSGALLSKLSTVTSVDGLTTTTQKDLTGSGTFVESTTVARQALADGGALVTKNDYVAAVLKDRSVTQTSADGLVTATLIDADGNGINDQIDTTTIAVDGSKTTLSTDYKASGAVAANTTTSVSFDGLVVSQQSDLDGDGIVDRTSTDARLVNADGSVMETLQTYQVSQKDANGDVATIAPVLLKTTTLTTSADGRTTTASVDFNADGTTDEVSATVTKINGSQVTTTTDNSVARSVVASLSDVQWNSAVMATNRTVAAATIVTLGADGLSRTVQADYDGNGSYEHTESWKTLLDGSQTGTITDVNGSGATIAKATVTIRADGLLTSMVEDSTNSGFNDHLEASLLRADGSKVKTVTDYFAGGALKFNTQSTVSPNGQSMAYVITGSANADTLTGGEGDDWLIGGAGADTLNGGNGSDGVSYETATAAVIASLTAPAGNTGDAAGDTYSSIENLKGSAYGDTLRIGATAGTVWGGAGDDNIYGGAGNDTLYGEDGSDWISGGAGADAIDGGAGDDWVSYETATTGVRADFSNVATNTGDAAGDTYSSIENLNGSDYADTLIVGSAAMYVWGGNGNDTIVGGASDDHL
ncbi:MAG: hypothetical protein ABI216_01140, partial [Devosia sp.]